MLLWSVQAGTGLCIVSDVIAPSTSFSGTVGPWYRVQSLSLWDMASGLIILAEPFRVTSHLKVRNREKYKGRSDSGD